MTGARYGKDYEGEKKIFSMLELAMLTWQERVQWNGP
jgi:hypothetical protein